MLTDKELDSRIRELVVLMYRLAGVTAYEETTPELESEIKGEG